MRLQRRLRLPQLTFGLLAPGDVSQNDGENGLATQLDLGDGRLDRKFLVIRPQTADGAQAPMRREVAPV